MPDLKGKYFSQRFLFINKTNIFLYGYYRNLLILVGIFLVVAFAYGSTLSKNYVFADDYFCLWTKLFQKNWVHEFVVEGLLQGRPLNGALVALSMCKFKYLSDYIYFHVLTIIHLIVLAYLICKFLSAQGWTTMQSFFISISLLLLPPVQVIASWAVTTFFVLSSILGFIIGQAFITGVSCW